MEESGTNYIALAIPVFFVLIGIEILVARHQRKDYYRFNDSINDLSMGILQQVTGIFAKGAIFFGYYFLYENWHWLELSMGNPWVWVAGFLGVDFCYYWFHRLSHEINVVWASHIAHHQSEEYNLTVALRQGSFQAFFSAVFYWPLALIGLPPLTFITLSSFNTLYQFWIHTRTIDRMWAPFEYIFNTPSHHRVHHGCNPQYIDRNHAGTLIIWDRMFGSFEPEGDEVIYGVTKPLKSWNPIWANVHYFVELADVSRRTRRLRDKFLIWFMPPHWRPEDVPMEDLDETPLKGHKYDARTNRRANPYVLVQFTLAVVATVLLLFTYDSLVPAQQAALAVFVVWTLTNCGATFEGRPWLTASEYMRLLGTAAMPWILFAETWPTSASIAISLVALLSVAWWQNLRSVVLPEPAQIHPATADA